MCGASGAQRANQQQCQILRDENITNIKPRNLCFVELRKLFKEKISDPNHIIIMGIDANETMDGTGPQSLARLISDLGLHDAL
jgi:hypothetical protein